jgi:hypothetical protein
VTVSVRPERIEVVRDDVTAPSASIPAVVAEVIYLGSHNQIVLDTGGVALIANVATDAGIAAGSRLLAVIPAQYATCFPAEQHA